MLQTDLSDCRCVRCHSPHLQIQTPDFERSDIIESAVICGNCGHHYESIHGIPYLLLYEPNDFQSLVEIAAEFGRLAFNPAGAENVLPPWVEALRGYHTAEDKAAFRKELSGGIAPWIETRYEQWAEIEALSGDLDLDGKKVLIVGAGLGFDASWIAARGADVTAVDLNPQTNQIGRAHLQRARWIGAMGYRLPFVDQCFDYVFCSASLHHVLDVSESLREMMRVTRVGGSVITTNDSYGRDDRSLGETVRQWNDHRDVLRGVNENVPNFGVYMAPLREWLDRLDVTLYTSMVYGWYDADRDAYENLKGARRWRVPDDLPALAETAGGLYMRIILREPVALTGSRAAAQICRPSEIARLFDDKIAAMSLLASRMPAALLFPPFPGEPGNTKMQTLNGWRWREADEDGREAYVLGRWFLQRGSHGALSVVIRLSQAQIESGTEPFMVVDKVHYPLRRDSGASTYSARVDLSALDADRIFVAEAHLGSEPEE